MNQLHQALRHLHQRPVAYFPVYADLMGSVAGGVVLSQLLYWASRCKGEFYKTDEELCRETGCSFKEMRNVKQKLRELPFLSVEVRGLPARTFYRVDWDALVEALVQVQPQAVSACDDPENGAENGETGQTSLAQRDKLESPKGPNWFSPKGQTIYKDSETTTETTYRERTALRALNAQGAQEFDHAKKTVQARYRLHGLAPPEEDTLAREADAFLRLQEALGADERQVLRAADYVMRVYEGNSVRQHGAAFRTLYKHWDRVAQRLHGVRQPIPAPMPQYHAPPPQWWFREQPRWEIPQNVRDTIRRLREEVA